MVKLKFRKWIIEIGKFYYYEKIITTFSLSAVIRLRFF